MSGSWVTTIMVTPRSRLSDCSVSMISCELRVSRLPVGSSASSRIGLLIKARAMATRCCWPPDNRRVALPVGQTQQFQRGPCPFGALGAAGCARRRIEQGQRDVLDRAGSGEKVETLKDKAQPFAADARQFRLRQPRDVDPFEIILSAGRPIEASEQRHQRGLPRAGRSHDGNKFAGLDHQVDAAQRMHIDVADVIGPRHVRDSDDWFDHAWADACGSTENQKRGTTALLAVASCSAVMTRSPGFRSPLTISVKLSSSSPVTTAMATGCPSRRTQTWAWS